MFCCVEFSCPCWQFGEIPGARDEMRLLPSNQHAPSALRPAGRIALRSFSDTHVYLATLAGVSVELPPIVETASLRGDAPMPPPSGNAFESVTLCTLLPSLRSNQVLPAMPLTEGVAPLSIVGMAYGREVGELCEFGIAEHRTFLKQALQTAGKYRVESRACQERIASDRRLSQGPASAAGASAPRQIQKSKRQGITNRCEQQYACNILFFSAILVLLIEVQRIHRNNRAHVRATNAGQKLDPPYPGNFQLNKFWRPEFCSGKNATDMRCIESTAANRLRLLTAFKAPATRARQARCCRRH